MREIGARIPGVMLVRNIARELLPYVVLFWATFALLGGAAEPVEKVQTSDGAVVGTGLGLCTLSVAYLLKAARRARPLLSRIFSRACAWTNLVTVLCPVVYNRPPLFSPSLERLQILRT